MREGLVVASPSAGARQRGCKWSWLTGCCRANCGQNRREVVADGLIGEAQYSIPSSGQERFSLSIILSLCGVDSTVKLDAQTARGAAEVEDEGANGMLAAKLQAFEAAIAESLPEYFFGCGLVDAQVSCGGYVLAMPGTLA
jgi:hypothetical protein